MMKNRRKHGLRALSLAFVAALGLMAYMASVAQAVDTKLWDETIGGTTTKITATLSFEISLVGELLMLVPAKELTIHCKKAVAEDGLLLTDGTGHMTLKLSECLTLQGEEAGGKLTDQPACDPGTTESKIRILQILHNGLVYLLFEPLNGTEFKKIKFPVGCPLPNNIAITGSLVMQCLEPANTVESCSGAMRVTHNISEAPEALFEGAPNNDILKYGTSRLLYDGTFAMKLISGSTWRGWF